MSPLPYLPSGESELPAARVVLFANTSHLIHKIDESAQTLNGTSFTGEWQSGTLGQGSNIEKTITFLTLVYVAASATTVKVSVSGDGGETWPESRTIAISSTSAGRLRRAQVGFNTSGFDIRVKIEFNTNVIFYLYEFHPVLVRRGEYVIKP